MLHTSECWPWPVVDGGFRLPHWQQHSKSYCVLQLKPRTNSCKGNANAWFLWDDYWDEGGSWNAAFPWDVTCLLDCLIL